MSNFKSGFIALAGRPNVGKSTLLNRLTGEKIAIVSNKPQTTRNRILSILTTDEYQMIFVDTPGVHKPRTKLGEFMNNEVTGAILGVDAVILVVEAGKTINATEEKLVNDLFLNKIPVILVINKVDAVEKEKILPQIEEFSSLGDFKAIVPMSALKGGGEKIVLEEIIKLIPEGPMLYPDDISTDQTVRQMASEIIREKLLRLLDKEVPHGTAVEIEEMKEGETLTKIGAIIYCEKESHKQIIIGKGGEMLKRIGSSARRDIEKLLDTKVYLSLWVKPKTDWRNSNHMLKELGYKEEK